MRHCPEAKNLPAPAAGYKDCMTGLSGAHAGQCGTARACRTGGRFPPLRPFAYNPARTSQSWKIRTGRLSSATGLHTNQ